MKFGQPWVYLRRLHGVLCWEGSAVDLMLFCDHLFFVCLFLVAQSCPTLCDPMDCSPPGFCIYGTLQARILELLFSSPGDFPDPGIEPESPAVTVFSLLIISQQHPCFYFSVSLTNYVVPILRESNIVNANFQDFMSWARVLGSNFVLVGNYSATQARREN